jgi:acyl-CoA thioester hydrolase
MREEKIGMAAVEQHIEYKRELYAGSVVTVASRVLEVRDKVIRFRHEMTNDETGELAATSTYVAVHLDTATRTARPLPEDVKEKARNLIGAQP